MRSSGSHAFDQRRGPGRPVVHLRVDVDGPLAAPGGLVCSFQMPCRFAGCEPGREHDSSRYRPYWKYSAASAGSCVIAKRLTRSSVGCAAASLCPGRASRARSGAGSPPRGATAASSKSNRAACARRSRLSAAGSADKIIEGPVVGRQGNQHQHFVGVPDVNAAGGAPASAFRDHLRAGLESHRAGDSLVRRTLPASPACCRSPPDVARVAAWRRSC